MAPALAVLSQNRPKALLQRNTRESIDDPALNLMVYATARHPIRPGFNPPSNTSTLRR